MQSSERLATLMGITYMFLFVSYGSVQNMLSQIYEQSNIQWLALFNLFVIYVFFGVAGLLSLNLVPKLGYFASISLSISLYILFELSGLLFAYCQSQQKQGVCSLTFITGISMLSSVLAGIGANMLWISQGSYFSEISQSHNRSKLFGIFNIFCNLSQIFGNILGTLILRWYSHLTYFSIMVFIALISLCMSFKLENIPIKSQPVPISQSLQKLLAFSKQKKNILRIKLWLFTGSTLVAFFNMLPKLVYYIEGNTNLVNYKTSRALIFVGLSMLAMSYFLKHYGDSHSPYYLNFIANRMVIIFAVLFIIAYALKSEMMVILIACVIGLSEPLNQTANAMIIGIQSQNFVQSFSYFRFYFSLGTALMLQVRVIGSMLGIDIFLELYILASALWLSPIYKSWMERKSSQSDICQSKTSLSRSCEQMR